MINAELINILRCPESKAKLILSGNKLISADPHSRRIYPIEEGTLLLLLSESEQLSVTDWENIILSDQIKLRGLI
ncbi:Trm112 family protein [Ignavibacterium album]|uniref:Trm112 family protein n=1 Tax=Ignavibacterium album TaxID=591197 RepID=UPI0035B86DF3